MVPWNYLVFPIGTYGVSFDLSTSNLKHHPPNGWGIDRRGVIPQSDALTSQYLMVLFRCLQIHWRPAPGFGSYRSRAMVCLPGTQYTRCDVLACDVRSPKPEPPWSICIVRPEGTNVSHSRPSHHDRRQFTRAWWCPLTRLTIK